MNKQELIINQLNLTGIIPLFYHSDLDTCKEIIKACYDGGLKVIEYTNRGEKALDNFPQLKQFVTNNCPDLLLGIGSIINKEQAAKFLQLGADFIVAPILDEETALFCADYKAMWIPGCGTLTEIAKAIKLGALVVKVFPGNVLGPGFVKAVLGPMPNLKLMPTGGVETTEDNLKAWFNAGVFCVGMGSNLITKDIIANKDYNKLTNKVKEVITIIHDLKAVK